MVGRDESLLRFCIPFVTGICSHATPRLEEAVELSHLLAGRDDVILCFGSLSYLGRILKLMEKRQTAGNKRKAKR